MKLITCFIIALLVSRAMQSPEINRMICDCRPVPQPKKPAFLSAPDPSELRPPIESKFPEKSNSFENVNAGRDSLQENDLILSGHYRPVTHRSGNDERPDSPVLKTINYDRAKTVGGVFVYETAKQQT